MHYEFFSYKANRCLHSGRECLGYNTPKPWIFEGVYSKSAANILQPVECPENQAPGSSDNTSDSRLPPAFSSHSAQQCPPLPAQVSCSFGNTPEERRCLSFYLYETGPTLANYGPDYGFWNGLIPLWAWQSPVCRHLLVATTLVDEQLGLYRKATTSKLTPQAL